MHEIVYLVSVTDKASAEIARRLDMQVAPPKVRVATLTPLSNYGYPREASGMVLKVSEDGIVIGVEGNENIPRAFVPWSNISYIAASFGEL